MLRRLSKYKPEQKMSIRWWVRFIIGPVPLQLALAVAFLALALTGYTVTAVVGQVNTNRDLLDSQSADRGAAIQANVRARHDDCTKLNAVRRGLRIVVTEGHAQTAGLKRIFPQLPASFFKAQNKIYHDELAFFADDNCHAYAVDALPNRGERRTGKRRVPGG